MKALISAARTRSGMVSLLGILLAAAVLAIASVVLDQPGFVIVILLIALVWAHLSLAHLAQQRTAKRTETLLQEGSNQTTDQQLGHLQRSLDEINTRVRKASRVTSDIAGSVGRSSPLVREIHGTLMKSRSGALTATAQSATAASNVTTFPAFESITRPKASALKVMTIADEFTAKAFAFEWDQVLPTPDNWLALMDHESPDLLFVESAWEGNSGSWKYHLVGQVPGSGVAVVLRSDG